MCCFCLPYLSQEDVTVLVANAFKLITSGGMLYISTMEGDYQDSGFHTGSSGDRVFTHYHSENYLTNALSENVFEIITTKRQAYPEQNGTTTTDLFIIAKASSL